MFFDEHKNAITTMMGKRSSKGTRLSGPTPLKPEIVKAVSGEMDGKHVAAQDVLAAIHEKSAEKMMTAMANFMDLHNAGDKSSSAPDAPEVPRE